MTKNDKIKVISGIKETVINHAIRKKKHNVRPIYKSKNGYVYRILVTCKGQDKVIDFKNILASEISNYLKQNKIKYSKSRPSKKYPDKIQISANSIAEIYGKKLNASQYEIKIVYNYE